MEGGRPVRRHQRSSRQGNKARSGPFTDCLDQKRHGSVDPISTTSNTPSAGVRLSTNHGHAPAAKFGFHSPESATNSTTSLPAETSSMNPWVADGKESKICGLVRRKSDLGPIAESDKVLTVNGNGVVSRDKDSRSRRRNGTQPPPDVVHHHGEATSSHLSIASEPGKNDNGKPNFRTSSSMDDSSLSAASGSKATSQTKGSRSARPQVLALSDHITCLRQKNLRRRADVITSGDHVIPNSDTEPTSDNKGVNGEW